MTSLVLTLPTIGNPNSTEAPKIVTDFTSIQTWANGNIDATNLSAAAAQSIAINQATQTVKGAVAIATTETRTNVAYGTMPTADQVTGIVLPANGLIAVWYQATWQQSVASAASAAIFLGANQVQLVNGLSPLGQSAVPNASTAVNFPLYTASTGLNTGTNTTSYTGDVTTGQILGSGGSGGPCYIFAAAGTYTVSVQFKASSGSVTASNRKLWVQALSFA